MPRDRCPTCEGGALEPLFVAVDVPTRHVRRAGAEDAPGDFGSLAIVSCARCGHICNAGFAEESTEDLYRVHPTTNAPVHQSMSRGLYEVAVDILGDRPGGMKILEIGCGTGALAKLLAEKAHHVDLIEPNLTLAETTLQTPGIALLPGFFPRASTGKRYDIVVCRQVLEHVPEPLPFLAAIRDHLAPGGTAYIEVPSMDYIARHASFVDFHYLHVHYFFRRNLTRLFARLGFRVLRRGDLKNGHDMGFTVARSAPEDLPWEGRAAAVDGLQRRLEGRRDTARTRLADFPGHVGLYGATAYSQALLAAYPPSAVPAAMLDDTPGYAGYEAYWRNGRAEVRLPEGPQLHDLDRVVVCAYLHDQAIAARLREKDFSGPIHTLRSDDLGGRAQAMSLFEALE
jgi:SAM-dependent methyltransferase